MRRTITIAAGLWLGLALSADAQGLAGTQSAGGTATGAVAETGSAETSGLISGLSGIDRIGNGAPDLGRMSLMAPGAVQSLLAPGAAATVPAQAGTIRAFHPVVVELYTSQGCSSCPPADALLAQVAGRDNVIALALHVDYWDYIGWADKFAMPGFTGRQKAYARAMGERAIYTPQMIVDGQDHLIGARPGDLVKLIDQSWQEPSNVALTLERHGDMVRISAEANPSLPRPAIVQLVRYRPEATVSIVRGENAGKVIRYSNIVTDWQALGEWSGQGPLELDAPAPGPDAAVVILQAPGPGPILAAEQLR